MQAPFASAEGLPSLGHDRFEEMLKEQDVDKPSSSRERGDVFSGATCLFVYKSVALAKNHPDFDFQDTI